MEQVDRGFGAINSALKAIVFAPISLLGSAEIPLAVGLLICAAVFFTLRLGWPQIRGFRHGIDVVRGVYDRPDEEGEVSSWQALTSALSATVGLGNIGGVAIAIALGGPGAAFWLIVAGFLGMASKFAEVTLALIYRETRFDGRVMGGGMIYLTKGFAEQGFPKLGQAIGYLFAFCCVGASFGGGNTMQVSQSLGVLRPMFPMLDAAPWIYGLTMSFAVGVVILGGIRRIAAIADKIVPTMCGGYVVLVLYILAAHASAIPGACMEIVAQAWRPEACYGGFLGVVVIGFQRAAFSNEAGMGSSAIAHCAAKTSHPVREGVVALLEPFIDTVVVCTMTALLIVVTDAYRAPAYAALRANNDGAALTAAAMAQVSPVFPYLLAFAVVLFAYSTMISWSYYGERCWAYIFGDRASLTYRLLFCTFVFLGSVASPGNILEFGDLLIFAMAMPNLVGVVWMAPKVRASLDEYLHRLKRGEF
jgi:AGCS family alanine or glycine:cation symporter